MFPPEKATEAFPYEIEEQVGSGSMGIVYRARDVDLHRSVAIKTLRETMVAQEPPETQDEMRRRFQQEAQAAAQISHPGVTVVHRVARHEETPFIVMEWLDGRSLEKILAEDGVRPAEEAARLTVELLEALDAGHQAGVVHRDIKPANLMVLKDGRLKVTDFGIALVKNSDLVQTRAGIVLATPQFASPEQLRGGEVDARSDIFATGVLLYHLMTGSYPFSGPNFLALANAILESAPEPLATFLPDVSPALEGVILKALEKDRRNRFQKAKEMSAALKPFLSLETDETLPDLRTADLGNMPTEIIRQKYTGLPTDIPLALVQLVESWPVKTLPNRPVAMVLMQLLDKPLHAEAFAGAAVLGDVCLFIEDGVLLGAVDRKTGETGDAVTEKLPAKSEAHLYALPSVFSERLVALMTSVLNPPVRRQSDLDSTFINLPALASKLREERFNGILRLQRAIVGGGCAWATLNFLDGNLSLSLFSEGWNGVPVERNWVSWVAEYPVRAHVEEKSVMPLAAWYRHALGNLELMVEMSTEDGEDLKRTVTTSTTGARIRELFRTPKTGAGRVMFGIHPKESAEARLADVGYERSPAYRFLSWALRELPPYMAERRLTGAWKYLSEWLALVEHACLYHDLPRVGSRDSDVFDLVTKDAKGKVLHLMDRHAEPSAQEFEAFLTKVITAKQARTKTGDVGGAFLVARRFNDEVLESYSKALEEGTESSKKSWLNFEEAFTGYAGFVRIGARRGFHLLLVEEKDDGFVPIIPNL